MLILHFFYIRSPFIVELQRPVVHALRDSTSGTGRMFLNYQIPTPSHFQQISTSDSALVAPNTRISIEPGKGEIHLTATDHLALAFALSAPDPKWIELAITLPFERWGACRQIFLSYRAAGSRIRVRPALRLGYENGFHDHFNIDEHVLAEEVAEFGAEFLIAPRRASEAAWMEILLFFGPEEGRLTIHDLALTGVR